MKKKLLVGVLGLSLAAMPTCAFAGEAIVIAEKPTNAVVSAPIMPAIEQVYGQISEIKELEDGNMQVWVETANGTLVFNCSEETWIADSEGLPMDLKTRINDNVLVYHVPIMTMSIPPQSPATAIIGNVTDESQMFYAVAEEVKHNEDGTVTVVTNAGSRQVTLNEDTVVVPFKTKNIVRAEDITVGSELLLSYQVMTASLPAYATAEKAVVLSINNAEDIEDNKGVEATEEIMLPLRSNAEALGYSVEFANGKIVLTKDEKTVSIALDSTEAEINSEKIQLTQAPQLKDGLTYVAKDFVELLAE